MQIQYELVSVFHDDKNVSELFFSNYTIRNILTFFSKSIIIIWATAMLRLAKELNTPPCQ